MRTHLPRIFLLSSLVVFLVSCQKEVDYANNNSGNNGTGGTGGTGNTQNITGDYNFVGMVAHTETTVTVSGQGPQLKAVTVSGYATKDNVGTLKVTASDFIYTGFGYSIDTMMNVKTYIDNVLFDDSDIPYVMSSPPTNGTTPYTRISADSITVTGAMGVSDPSGAVPTGPVGMKLRWSGDTLILKVTSSFTQSVTQGGVPGVITASLLGISKFKKR